MNKAIVMWAGLGLAVLIGLYFVSKKAAGAIGAAGQAINPVNPLNIFSQGAGAVSGVFSGSGTGSLGSDVYDAIHGGGPSLTAATPIPAQVIDFSGTYSNEPILSSGSLRDLVR